MIDDEAKWRENLLKMLEKYYEDNPVVVDAYGSGEEFLQQGREYDIVLLDIEMGGISGFETAMQYQARQQQGIIIILTTHVEMSRQGYKVNAFRYIDKLNMEEELPEALAAAGKRLSLRLTIQLHAVNLGEISLMLKDILYIETEKRNVLVHTMAGDYICNNNISDIEIKLEKHGFFRCHKSYIVNLNEVKSFDRISAQMADGSSAMISARKYPEFKKQYLSNKFEYGNG